MAYRFNHGRDVAASEWVGLTRLDTLLSMSLFYLVILTQLCFSIQKCGLRRCATLLAGYTGSWVALLYQSHDVIAESILAMSAFSHAAVAAYFAYRMKETGKLFQTLLVLLSSLWLGITAIFLLGQAHWGLAWLVEGMILLYLAMRLEMKQGVFSAQILIGLAVGYNFVALFPYLPLPALHSFDGWVLALSMLTGVAYWARLLNTCGTETKVYLRIRAGLLLSEAAWASFLFLATMAYWLEAWLTLAALPLQIALLFWSKYQKQSAIEGLAVVLGLIPVALFAKAIIDADSLFLSDLSWEGRVALASIFIQLWSWAEIHRRFYSESRYAKYSEWVRLAFYLMLPVVWIGSAVRVLEQEVISIVWLSPLIALVLAMFIGHRALKLETKVLTVIAGGLLIAESAFSSKWPVILGLTGFSGLYFAAYAGKHRFKNLHIAPFIQSVVLICSGISLPLLCGLKMQSMAIGFSVATIYWLLVYMNPLNNSLFRLNHKKALVINRGIFLASLVALPDNPWLGVLTGVYLLVGTFTSFEGPTYYKSVGWHKHIQRHLLLAVSYTLFLIGFDSQQALLVLGPLVAIHGVLVVLQDRSHASVTKLGFGLLVLGIIKIAVWDVNTSALWQKVLMFIGIGIFLLVASFWYQRLMMKYQDLQEGS